MTIVATFFEVVVTSGHGIRNVGKTADRFIEGNAHSRQGDGFNYPTQQAPSERFSWSISPFVLHMTGSTSASWERIAETNLGRLTK
jgi:hypothetical protein